MGQVLGIVYRVIATHLIKKAGQPHAMAYTGEAPFSFERTATYGRLSPLPASASIGIKSERKGK